MELKDISRDRLEQIAAKLMNRVEEFEGAYNGGFVNALAWDGISLDEANAITYWHTFDKWDIARHKIVSGFKQSGTHHLHFTNEETELDDATELCADNADDLEELWHDFCMENDLEVDCLINVEFICSEFI